MSFLVYFFVLLVAAGSVIFGLDWTQAPINPPPYATPITHTAADAAPARAAVATAKPAPVVKPPATVVKHEPPPPAIAAVASNEDAATSAHADATPAPAKLEATQAQAKATEPVSTASTASTAVAEAGHCNIAVCSSSYRSFRSSDCTYQPYDGPRRLCTKTAEDAGIASVSHARASRREEARDRRRRMNIDRSYADRGDGGWLFDLFGDRR